MNPKKPDHLVSPVAKKLGIAEKLVEHVMESYWKAIRSALTNAESNYIKLHGLGTFKAKSWKIPEVITRYESLVGKYKSIIDSGQRISFQRFAIMKELEERLVELYKLRELVEEDESKRLLIKQKRNAKEAKNNLEEPEGDIPGNKE